MSKGRKTNRDRAKKIQHSLVEDEAIASQLEDLVKPVIIAQQKYYQQPELRQVQIWVIWLFYAILLDLCDREIHPSFSSNIFMTPP